MKTVAIFGFAVVLAVTFYFINTSSKDSLASNGAAIKRDRLEAETKVRPEYFEAMKWNPVEEGNPMLRAPASKRKTK